MIMMMPSSFPHLDTGVGMGCSSRQGQSLSSLSLPIKHLMILPCHFEIAEKLITAQAFYPDKFSSFHI
jgi:hypothetical protein